MLICQLPLAGYMQWILEKFAFLIKFWCWLKFKRSCYRFWNYGWPKQWWGGADAPAGMLICGVSFLTGPSNTDNGCSNDTAKRTCAFRWCNVLLYIKFPVYTVYLPFEDAIICKVGNCCNLYVVPIGELDLIFFITWICINASDIIGSHAIVRVLKCKAWKRPEKHYSTSMKLQRQYITQEHVGGSDLSTIAADKKLKERFLVHASSEHPLESQPSKSPWDSVHDAVDAFYRFSRPHTIIGTVRSTTPILSNITCIWLMRCHRICSDPPFVCVYLCHHNSYQILVYVACNALPRNEYIIIASFSFDCFSLIRYSYRSSFFDPEGAKRC